MRVRGVSVSRTPFGGPTSISSHTAAKSRKTSSRFAYVPGPAPSVTVPPPRTVSKSPFETVTAWAADASLESTSSSFPPETAS